MTLTVSHFVEAYKQANGTRPDENSMRFIEHLDRVGQIFRMRGREDAEQDREPKSEAEFKEASMKLYGKDPEWAQMVADMAFAYYMEGYEGDDK